MSHRSVLFAIALGMLGSSALGGAWTGAGWFWDGANALGFLAAALVVFLHIETGAARNRPTPHAAFYARLHNNLALLAVLIVVAHVGVLLADDPVTFEYWKLSAPLYMLAGIVASVLLIALVATAYPKPRRVLFRDVARFRRVHGYGSITIAGLITWHIAGSGFYLDTVVKQMLLLLALVVLPLWLVRQPRRQRPLVDAQRREPAAAIVETRRVAVAAIAIAAVFSALRNLL